MKVVVFLFCFLGFLSHISLASHSSCAGMFYPTTVKLHPEQVFPIGKGWNWFYGYWDSYQFKLKKYYVPVVEDILKTHEHTFGFLYKVFPNDQYQLHIQLAKLLPFDLIVKYYWADEYYRKNFIEHNFTSKIHTFLNKFFEKKENQPYLDIEPFKNSDIHDFLQTPFHQYNSKSPEELDYEVLTELPSSDL